MQTFKYFMTNLAKAALAHSICATKEDEAEQERTFTTCLQLVNYLLATYATDDVIA